MAVENWPELGRYLSPLEENPQPAVRRTPMEDGFVKQREYLTRQRTEHPIRLRMTAAEFASFKAWYRGNVEHGAKLFNWDDPADGANKEARIKGGQYQGRSRLNQHGAPIEWELSMTLESWDA